MEFNTQIQVERGLSEKILGNLTNRDLFVFSSTSLELITDYKIGHAKQLDRNDLGINLEAIDNFIKTNSFNRIVSLGNGQTSDIAKYISYKKNVEHICIPAIFSTNVSFTDKSCLKISGRKETVQSKPPEKVVIDYDLMMRAKFKYHYYGLCDIISIYTALSDWNLSKKYNKERIDPFSYNIADTLTKTLEDHIQDLEKQNTHSLDIILELVMMSGYVTNIYGSGRPESGSEHIFAKALESKIDIFHAISVGLGTLLMAKLQKRNYKIILATVRRLGLLDEAQQRGITKELVISCLTEIKPKRDRFSILDVRRISIKLATKITNQVFKDCEI